MDNLIVKGGWVMVPILASSVVALTLVLERIWFFARNRVDREDFARSALASVRAGDLRSPLERCRQAGHPLAAVYAAGLESAGEGPVRIEKVMEREAQRQVERAEKNLDYLSVVIGIAPLLGFLGTILGLIKAFMAWEKFSTSVTVSQLAAGIYQAMLTTAAGLIVAIPYFVIYHVLLSRVGALAKDLNHYGDELIVELSKQKAATR
ncbi:MAG: hypothetical protein MOGMAGMI_00557 [Candidatus Omnitrophica bacterium]|nr:hypothetical protein [Candidatus Omnitrophota bacterium]